MHQKRMWSLALALLSILIMTTAPASAQVVPRALSQTGVENAADIVTFRVRIQNVSSARDVPILLSPGAWVQHSADDPFFTAGAADRGEGLESLAEDGNPAILAESLRVKGLTSGIFNTPVCADAAAPLQAGEFYEFEVTASPETPYLSFASMLVQSNDLFLAPAVNGIPLFDEDGRAIGFQIVTDQLLLWDAGTEANEEPGGGPNQAPRQPDANTGPADEMATVRPVDDRFSYPAVADLVQVYIVPISMLERDQGQRQAPAPIYSSGETFRVGDVEWRVLSETNLGHELSAGNNRQTTDERFVQLRFHFLNTGSDPLEFEAVDDLALRDGQDRTYMHYRVPGIPAPHYPTEFIDDEEECFGSRWFGRWTPFVLKPNSPTTCTAIFEVYVDATDLVLLVPDLASNQVSRITSVGLNLPPISPHSIGDVVRVGDVRWQLLSTEDFGHLLEANGNRTKTQHRFVSVRFQFTNKGSADLGFPGAVLRDKQGREYERRHIEFVAEDEQCAGTIFGPYPLRPNTITTCTSIYEVSADATGLIFIADDLGGKDHGPASVALGLSDLIPIRVNLLGEDLQVGDVCWRLLSVEDLGQELTNDEGETAKTQGRFLQTQFRLLNLSSETLGYEGVALLSDSGSKYWHFGERLNFIDDDVECPPSRLPPGRYLLRPNTPTVCTAIYEVAEVEEKMVLLATDLEGYEAVIVAFPNVTDPSPPSPVSPGTYEVGNEISPGIYRGESSADLICKWARLRDIEEDPDNIIAMGIYDEGQFYVEIRESDKAFTTECSLVPIEHLQPSDPLLTSLTPGVYLVGLDIGPGRYEGDPGEDLFCFWQRLRNLAGDEESTIEWGLPGEKFVVEVDPTDYAVEFHCPVKMVE